MIMDLPQVISTLKGDHHDNRIEVPVLGRCH